MKLAPITLLLGLAVVLGCSSNEVVQLEHGVEFRGIELHQELGRQANTDLLLTFYTAERQPDSVFAFVHMESSTPDTCRIVADVPLPKETGEFDMVVPFKLPETCDAGRLELFAGLYDRETGIRYEIESYATADDRMHVGWFDIVDSPPADSRAFISPSGARWHARWKIFEPWLDWLVGLCIALLVFAGLTLLLSAREEDDAEETAGNSEPPTDGDEPPVDGDEPHADGDEPHADGDDEQVASEPRAEATPAQSAAPLRRGWRWASYALLMLPMTLSLLVAIDFVKDDAYISFRYAHNLANGDGLVFNVGDRLEGFTNFLWTLVLTPFEALGWDLFQVTEVLGFLFTAGVIVAVTFTLMHWLGARRDLSQMWAGMWVATSSSLALWSTSGMEQSMTMFLPLASAALLWSHGADHAVSSRRALWSGILMGLGCMSRPEVHLIGIVVGLPLVWDVVKTRKVAPFVRFWFIGLLAITVPFHLFRFLYFGALFPNTFYVKTASSSLVMLGGLANLNDMFSFNLLGLLVLLTPFAFLRKEHLLEKLVALGVALGFMVYVVKVGADEMRWHRLYLPGLPFLALLAGAGARNLADAVMTLAGKRKWAGYVFVVLMWGLVLGGAWKNFKFTYDNSSGFNGRGDISGNYHPDIGKFITRHDRPHALVAFQDMGSTPYHAPDIDFLDFIGLVDRTVAQARYTYGLHPFIATESHRKQADYDADMRKYFYERAPEWTVLTAYVPLNVAVEVGKRVLKNPTRDVLRGYRNNSYQFGLDEHPEEFDKKYVFVRSWARSSTYYLSLYRRRDLWEQTPGEIVLDEVPEGLGGVKAKFEGGLELLGSEIETTATERHEFFVTTWWRAPGAISDLLFFVHLNKEGFQAPFDHPPGDWLYTPERWKTGQLIEDRTLIQLPVNALPGTYQVNFGAWHPGTGERLKLLEGPDDGSSRLKLGELTITPLVSLRDQLVPPTDPEKQRKYPDRIIDSGR